jgi:cellulose synthase/poly-beta-1,6-N-acetylglucosamine synthase-like glycosyltransferase
LFWIWRLRDWNSLGQVFWVMSLLATLLYIAYSFGIAAFTPLHPVAFVVALILTFIEMAALALALTYAYESLDVCCRIRWRRWFTPQQTIPGYMPKVSLHVPAYNEPVEVVEATLRSLAQLDYPNYEVLLVDNNTPDEVTWRPLEKLCEELGPRFRFLHLDKWPGYKSGALNFAMTQTAPDAEMIGIIDADYLVSPAFLRELTPFFADPTVAFVQTPQDYRDYKGNSYLEACRYGYNYFFAVSMPSRNEHNAIIFAGTMGLIRQSVLQEIGGWDEWCITEDAEASLRVLKRGYQSIYVNKSYGTGLMPYSFDGLKKQRFRWCFGGIQILKKHWEALMPWARWTDPTNRLTLAQRYYYLVGGLQWFNEPLNLCFTVILIMGALAQFTPTEGIIRPLTGPIIVMPAIFLVVGMWRFLWVLRKTLRLSYKDAFRSMAHFFSLGWTVTLACIQGMIQQAGVFMRTPKTESRSSIVRAFRAAQWETAIGLTCLIFALVVTLAQPQIATIFLSGLLAWQAFLYLSAPYYSLSSVRNRQPERRVEVHGPAVTEGRIARWAFAIALVLFVGIAGALLLPPPAETPTYAPLQPQNIQVRELVGLPPQPTVVPPLPTAAPPLLIFTPTPSLSPVPSATFDLTGTIMPTAVTGTSTVPPGATATFTTTPLPTTAPLPTIPPTAVPATATPLPTTAPTLPPATATPVQPTSSTAPPTPTSP